MPRNTPDAYAPLLMELLFEAKSGQVIEIPTHEFLRSFEVRFSSESAVTATIELFDFGGDYLESLFIAENASRKVSLRWGWDNGHGIKQYPPFNLSVTKYEPTFTPEGVEIQITLAPGAALKAALDKESRSWPAGKTATEIFRDIADARKWPMFDKKGHPTVEESEGFLPEMSQAGESDIRFIRQILLPKAMNVGKRSFLFLFDQFDAVHFHSDTFWNHVGAVYNFARNAMGDVISFAPTNASLFGGLWGAGNAVYVSIDSKEGTRTEIKTTDEGGIPGSDHATHPDSAHTTDHPGDRKARIAITARTPAELEHRAVHRLDLMRNAEYPATLEVKGTHAVQPQDYVTVNYYKHDGQVHYLSGTFRAKTVVHNVDTSGWRTTMELIRSGHRVVEKGKKVETSREIKPKKDEETQDVEQEPIQSAQGLALTGGTVTKRVFPVMWGGG